MKILLSLVGVLLLLFGAFILLGAIVTPSDYSFFEDLIGSILFGITPVVLGGTLIFLGFKIKQKD